MHKGRTDSNFAIEGQCIDFCAALVALGLILKIARYVQVIFELGYMLAVSCDFDYILTVAGVARLYADGPGEPPRFSKFQALGST